LEKPKTSIVVKPQAGDVVLCLEGPEIGRYAVIEGAVGVEKDTFMMCFNASAFRDAKSVSCSGGPSYQPSSLELEFSGRKIKRTFWKWRDGTAGAGNGESYELEVNLWYQRRAAVWFNFRPIRGLDDLKAYDVQCNQAYDDIRSEMDALKVNTDDYYRVMRGDHLIAEYREFYDLLWESEANIIIDAYQRHVTLSLVWHDEPIGCGYVATMKVIGSSNQTAFRSANDVRTFLDAYGLSIEPDVTGPWGQQVIKPALDNWKPLTLVTETHNNKSGSMSHKEYKKTI
jgi:hypothetical protein